MKLIINNQKLLLFSILVLAAVLRLVAITKSPPSLYWEEAAIGYDAYSILKTGKDYHGNAFPLIAFPSFGDYKPSLYFYATVPSIAIFGLNDFAIRFPSAFSGVLTVLLVYLISKELFKSKSKIPLLASFLLAISPWHLQFSRAGFEVNLATFLLTLGIYFLIKSLKNNFYFFLGAVVLGLSLYAYHGLRIIAPIFALIFTLTNWSKINFKWKIVSVIVALIISWPILGNINNPQVKQRFQETSHFTQSSAINISNQLKEQDDNLISRLIHHRYILWGRELLQNYTNHFNLNFLFISGDNNPRHQTREFGLLYHWELITLFSAIYFFIKRKHFFLNPIFLWILVAPTAAMLTKTTPHTLRFLPAAPAFAIISAYGLIQLLKNIKLPKTFIILGTSTIILAEAIVFLHFYFFHYPQVTSQHWQYGYKQLIQFTESVKDNYTSIYITREYGRPSVYALLYGQYDPLTIQKQEPSLPKDQLELLSFDKYKFTPAKQDDTNILVVTATDQPQSNRKLIKTIDFLDHSTAFFIYEQ